MPSFEERYYRRDPTWRVALARDLQLLSDLARALWAWLVPGWRLRRALRRAKARGEPLSLEDLP